MEVTFRCGRREEPVPFTVLLGQGVVPESFDSIVDSVLPREASAVLSGMRKVITETAEAMPSHQSFIDRCCRAEAVEMPPPAAVAGR